jgi:hypothetical protein
VSTRAWLGAAAFFAATGAAAGAVWSCGDPVHDAQVAALGDEQPGVPMGPTHRAGQPCLTCHGGSGPASLELSVAGTIYQAATDVTPPLSGAAVTVFDATELADGGTPHATMTNTAGNFYFARTDFSPAYALHDISVSFNGAVATMQGNVGRDGSCATCHFDPKRNDSHGHIYLVLDPADLPGASP